MLSSRESSCPKNQTHISCGSCIAGKLLTIEPPGEDQRETIADGIHPERFTGENTLKHLGLTERGRKLLRETRELSP